MRYIIFVLLFVHTAVGFSQKKIVLSGYVKDMSTGESLIGALVSGEGKGASVSTNSYGFFSIALPEGEHVITISFVGYETQEFEVVLDKSLQRNFELLSTSVSIEAIEISQKIKERQVASTQMSNFQFTTEEIKKIPVVFGEKDILKTIQLFPGVAGGNEGTTNFYVRGGGADQNLILLDEATVYNASHLLGFFSSFNSDAVKDVNLYKGGIPAQYGGRISSVLDINMIDGNDKEYVVEGGIGLIASRLKVEGPIVKDKSSFMISARRTYADMFLKLSKDEDARNSNLYFYDLNAKMNYEINEKNTLYLSGYFGKDDLGYSDLFKFDWGNATATLRWNRIINSKLFSNTSLIYSDFRYNVNITSGGADFRIASKIENFNLKQDFSYYINNKSTIRFGVNVLNQHIRPASIAASENSEINSITSSNRKGLEASAYVSHDWKTSDKFSMNYGLRMTDFMVVGPGTFYTFDQEGDPIGESVRSSGILKHYLQLEPRLSLNYRLESNKSVKASYNRIAQNLHQLTNTTSSLPTDQYVVSSFNIKPQIANQVALGYFQDFDNAKYEFSTEIYYKKMDNQIDFRNGADLQANEYLEGQLLFGIGRSYGIEWLIRKNRGKLHGWLSYTLAKSERQFDQINDGRWYNSRQDRTHDISLVGMYDITKNWSFGATWVFNTGQAVTYPSAKYEMNGRQMLYYAERNGYRMPNYHRLDISAVFEPKVHSKRFHSSWSFGVYNVYNRKNAYIIDFRESETKPNAIETYRIALFGAIPAVTWNFKF